MLPYHRTLLALLFPLSVLMAYDELTGPYTHCDICPTRGTAQIFPDATIPGANGTTCGQAERAAILGQYSSRKCTYLQDQLNPICCGANGTTQADLWKGVNNGTVFPETNTKVFPTDLSKDRTQCYVAINMDTIMDQYVPFISNFCIEDVGLNNTCFASQDGLACDSCIHHRSAYVCQDNGFSNSGYKLECSSSWYATENSLYYLCGHRMVFEGRIPKGQQHDENTTRTSKQDSFQHTTPRSTSNSYSYSQSTHSQTDDGTMPFIGPLVFIVLASKIQRFLKALIEKEEQANRRNNLSARPAPVVRGIVVSGSIAPPSNQNPPLATASPVSDIGGEEQASETAPLICAVPVTSYGAATAVDQSKNACINNAITKIKRWDREDKDLIFTDPLAVVLQSEARNGFWDEFLSQINNYRTGSWDLRAYYVDLFGNNFKVDDTFDWDVFVEQVLEGNVDVAGDRTLAAASVLMVQGVHQIGQAWAARGTGWAHTVTMDGRQKMRSCLESARLALLKASELDQKDPTPYSLCFPPDRGHGLVRTPSSNRMAVQSAKQGQIPLPNSQTTWALNGFEVAWNASS